MDDTAGDTGVDTGARNRGELSSATATKTGLFDSPASFRDPLEVAGHTLGRPALVFDRMPYHTRLRSVLLAVRRSQAEERVQFAPSAEVAARTPAPAAESDTDPPLLLTASQLKGWIARGYIALPVNGLPKAFHDRFHAATEAQKRSNGSGRSNNELAAAVDAVLSSKVTRGALTSILGPGFVGNVPGAGGSAGSNDADQGYHSTSFAAGPSCKCCDMRYLREVLSHPPPPAAAACTQRTTARTVQFATS